LWISGSAAYLQRWLCYRTAMEKGRKMACRASLFGRSANECRVNDRLLDLSLQMPQKMAIGTANAL